MVALLPPFSLAISLLPFLSIPDCIIYVGHPTFGPSYLSLPAMCCIILWKTNANGLSSVSYLNPAIYLSRPHLLAFPHSLFLNLRTRSSLFVFPFLVLPLALFSLHLPLSVEVVHRGPTPDEAFLSFISPLSVLILLSFLPSLLFPRCIFSLMFPNLVTLRKFSLIVTSFTLCLSHYPIISHVSLYLIPSTPYLNAYLYHLFLTYISSLVTYGPLYRTLFLPSSPNQQVPSRSLDR